MFFKIKSLYIHLKRFFSHSFKLPLIIIIIIISVWLVMLQEWILSLL